MNPTLKLTEELRSENELLKQVHTHSLDLLETCGVRFHSEKARRILGEAGARVAGDMVRIPADLVESALKKAPRTFYLDSRDGKHDLDLNGQQTYFSQDGCAAHTLDFETGERRRSTRADIEKMARISDYLEAVDIITPTVSAADSTVSGRAVQELEACFVNTGKHVVTESTTSARDARAQIELAAVIAGGEKALRERPILSNFVCTISPLTQDAGGMEAALEYAAAGIPVGIYPMATTGVTSPVNLASNLAVDNTEILSVVTLLQIASPGAKIFYSGGPATIDLRTGAYTATSPEAIWLRSLIARMAEYYHLPSIVGAGATSAKLPGAQSAWENALSYLPTAMAGADVLFGVGLLDGSNLLTYEQIILDAEVAAMVKRLLAPVSFDQEAFCVDLIKQIGSGGVYLDQTHTVKNMRKALSLPLISDRDSYDGWVQKGRIDSVSAARAKVKEILASHQPAPLPAEVRREMGKVVAAYSG
ncbi:MAG: trimethylamine methyltransferase family protein [Anaerolineales bacterium]|jgi:trimethylamine--corrinoid protein Co-methyltransferase